jgi:hypothetical protein
MMLNNGGYGMIPFILWVSCQPGNLVSVSISGQLHD